MYLYIFHLYFSTSCRLYTFRQWIKTVTKNPSKRNFKPTRHFLKSVFFYAYETFHLIFSSILGELVAYSKKKIAETKRLEARSKHV